MKLPLRTPSRGFSLLEVLVAVVILSVGLLALASLQVNLIRSSADAKAQTTATELAKDKLEALRSYTTLDGYINIVAGAAYNTTVGGTVFTVTPSVDRWVYDTKPVTPVYSSDPGITDSEATLSADTGHTYVLGRDFKKLTVAVTWSDAANNPRSITIDDLIDGLDPTASANVVKNSSAVTPRNIEVIIASPSLDTGVIPIAIDPSNNESTAATNPRPIVDQGGNETRFDVYTYKSLASDASLALAESRVETTMVGCTCDTATADSTDTAYRPTYWNGYRYVAPTASADPPAAGHANLGNGKNATTESPYCTQCCRDHNDPSSIASNKPRFDPWRKLAGHDHDHYYYDDNGILTLAGSGHTSYIEACRMIRVDGIYRTAVDFNNEYFNLLRTKNDGSTTEFGPTDTAITNYQNIALDYLDDKIVSNSDPSTYNNKVAAATVTTLESNRNINDPSSITLQRTNDHKYLHSRGLYIDYLEQDALDAIAQAKADCVTSSCTDSEKSVAVLSLTPFTSINLTELTTWAQTANDIAITDGSFYNSAAASTAPIRGYTTPFTITDPAAHNVDGTAKMLPSNSGLVTRSDAIDNDEATDVASNTTSNYDTQTFAIPAGVVSGTQGTFTVAFSGYDFAVFPQFSGTNITTCTKTKVGNGQNATYQYTCGDSNVPTSPLTLTASSYNYTGTTSTGATLSCTNSDGKGGGTVSYTTAGDSIATCQTYTLVSGASNAVGVTATSPSFSGSGLTQTGSIDFSTVSNNDTLTLTFTGPVASFPSTPVCTYTCSKSSCSSNGNKQTFTITEPISTCP